jgi:3-hydroxyacyl-CoA dehydrogenase
MIGGLMGSGIVQTSAQSGHKVVLVDVSQDALNKSVGSINKVWNLRLTEF